MQNIIIFLANCGIVGLFACVFYKLGKHALVAWGALLCVLANLFVYKQISILGFNATSSDIYAIATLLSLNLLQEGFGKEIAKKAVWINTSCLLFFLIMSHMHLMLVPSSHDYMHPAYVQLLSHTPRVVIASLTAFALTQMLNLHLYSILRNKFPKIPVQVTTCGVIIVAQAFDTVCFNMLGLYGIINAIAQVMIISFSIKMLSSLVAVPYAFGVKKIVDKF